MRLYARCIALVLLYFLATGTSHGVLSESAADYVPCMPGESSRSGPSLPVNDPQARERLINYICFAVAPDGSEAAIAETPSELNDQVLWRSTSGKELVFANSPSTFWFSLSVHNPSRRAGLWYLELSYAPVDHLAIWISGDSSQSLIETGDRTEFSTRAVDYRHFLAPVALEAGESKTITLRIESSGAINVPLFLKEPGELISQSNHNTLTNGFFYGSLLIFSVFNLLLFLSSGRSYYFYNSFYMISTGLFLFAMGGFAFQYLWPTSPWLANAAIPMSEALAALSMVLFGRSFLEIDTNQRRVSLILKVFAISSVLLFGLAVVLPYADAIVLNTLFGLIVITSLLMIGIVRWRQGYSPAKWYVLSWTLVLVGTGLYAMAAFGHLGDFMAHEVLMQGAFAGQVLLLNYAMVQRWRMLNDRLLAAEHDAKHELELKVHERTSQLRDTMRELERANRQLAEISTHDSLTGLHNRRYLDTTLSDMCAESRRTGQPLAMILLDADHFKVVNDTWGHGFGDQCLQKIAEVLTRHVRRPRDTATRFGGEEFALILPNTDVTGAERVAQRILADMASLPLATPDGQITRISLSAGVAVLEAGENENSLFARADDALYQAKALGRNRVEVAVEAIEQDD
ncbi:sensor domain-containing diguanylate cyclase [Marinobacter salicampi]|uniref:sensor domain-containing diguanylate cyclase n=1 Tax=Marinobacter salicampi TaxID=435907 RepID=UPI0014073D90|nr:diguanylate cyclase [Marinobacter salicampi]